jgi:hypothetical protein
MGFQAVLGDVEARNFDRWATGVDALAAAQGISSITTVVDGGDVTVVNVGNAPQTYQWDVLPASVTATLPDWTSTPLGKVFIFRDNTGLASNTVRINIVPATADAVATVGINGLLAYPITLPRGWVAVVRGNTRWNLAGEALLTRLYSHVVTNPNPTSSATYVANGGTTSGSASYSANAGTTGTPSYNLSLSGGRAYNNRIDPTTGHWFFSEVGPAAVFKIDGPNFVMGTSAGLGTSATEGFHYNHTMAGRPTGTPTAHADRAPWSYDRTNYRLDAYIGGAWESIPMRCLNVQTTDVSNPPTGVATDLHTFTLPAGVLARNGESIEAEWTLTTVASTPDTVVIVAQFGATALMTLSQVALGGSLKIRSRIYRTGAATQKAETTVVSGDSVYADSCVVTIPAETLSGAIVVKVTGNDTGATGNLVTCRLSSVRFIPLGV